MQLRHLKIPALTTALVLLLVAAGVPAETPALEYQVKAAFVYNFTKFVEWPVEAFASCTAPIVVTILGNSSNTAAFETIRGKSVKKRKIEVRTARKLEEVGATHVLFVCASEKPHLNRILEFSRNAGILTISDIGHFDQSGGIISFVTVDDKVRFQINLAAARRSGLKISSQLMKLARNVIE